MNRYKKLAIIFLIGLAIFTVARFGLFLTYYDKFSSYKIGEIISVFITGIRFDASILMTLFAPFLLLLMLPIQNKIYHKIVLWLVYVLYVAITIILVGDIIYFGYVSRHLTNEPYLMGNDIGFMLDMLPSYIIHIILAIIIAIISAFLWQRYVVNIALKSDLKCIFANLTIMLIVSGLSYIVIRGNVALKPIALIDGYNNVDMNLGNLRLNGLFSTARYIHNDILDKDAYDFFDNDTALKILNKNNSAKCLNLLKDIKVEKPNIVFILIESGSAYYVDSFSGNNFALTPNIDNLSKTSINFMRHYAVGRRSITAVQSILTGIAPINGIPVIGFGLEGLNIDESMHIGSEFIKKGYHTFFLQSSPRRSFYIDSIASSLKFEEYYGMEDTKMLLDYPDKNASIFGWDYETLMLLSEKIKIFKDKNHNTPFFAFVFTGTTHTPYATLPDQFMRYPSEPNGLNGYKNTLIYLDWSIGEFMKSIKDEEFYNDTIFIITADHNSAISYEGNYPNDYRLPLLIYSPKMKKKVVIENVTSHLNLFKTIENIAGINNKEALLSDTVFCTDDNSTAMIFHGGGGIGLVTKDGYLNHSLKAPLDYKLESDNSTVRISALADYMKAYHQLLFHRVIDAR